MTADDFARFLELEPCHRGDARNPPILFVGDGLHQPGWLDLGLDGVRCTIPMRPLLVRVMLALFQAWHRGESDIEERRGYLTAERLSRAIRNGREQGEEKMMRDCIWEIRKKIREGAMRKGIEVDPTEFLETGAPLLGYRIGCRGLVLRGPGR